ncbi:hypothetical protein SAMN05421748_110231 [Paractinoplanes atraurantiacus]|uniref:Uncharacterized protein n=1 Tax=Paractinoplanes atraurantiacus TaxID=1036182 RepID=A0A285IQ85_9ACTN|nr:hypothetical protein SAMN05421748_110231 [Actinoplanes atraurantiacus]
MNPLVGSATLPHARRGRTFAGVTDLAGILLFAGIPLAVVGLIFGLVFLTSAKPSREPITKPVMDKDAEKPVDSGEPATD